MLTNKAKAWYHTLKPIPRVWKIVPLTLLSQVGENISGRLSNLSGNHGFASGLMLESLMEGFAKYFPTIYSRLLN